MHLKGRYQREETSGWPARYAFNRSAICAASSGADRDDQSTVNTAQIAPTILARLDLDPQKLQAVVAEHTQVLPGT